MEGRVLFYNKMRSFAVVTSTYDDRAAHLSRGVDPRGGITRQRAVETTLEWADVA